MDCESQHDLLGIAMEGAHLESHWLSLFGDNITVLRIDGTPTHPHTHTYIYIYNKLNIKNQEANRKQIN